ncbi:transposase [Streptomyces virginiae]|uniref:transposase n=1 Tax=Streptomyces virginiae TaxID=1961 RepID=UPI00368A1A25
MTDAPEGVRGRDGRPPVSRAASYTHPRTGRCPLSSPRTTDDCPPLPTTVHPHPRPSTPVRADRAGTAHPSLAGSLTAVLGRRKPAAGRIEELLEAHPSSRTEVLNSMPEVGVRTEARILIDGDGDGDGDGSTFPTAGHLAAHAGLAPTTRHSGSSIRGEQPSRRGHKQLERALSLPSFATSGDPASRIHHDRKITQGTHRTQTPLRLAGRRTDVPFTVRRDGTCYEPRPANSGRPSSGTPQTGQSPFIETVDHDRVITQDARTHALIDRRPHTRFIAQDRQSAVPDGLPPGTHHPDRRHRDTPRTGRNRRAGSPTPGPSRPATHGRPCHSRSRRGAAVPEERRESTVPGGSVRPRIAA